MNAPTQALRVALIHGARIIEDRTFEPGRRATITVGSDPKSTLCVPMAEPMRPQPLFTISRAGVRLLTASGREGAVATGGREAPLASFAASEVALERGAKGRVRLGDVTVVFQLVTPPPAPPVPELPAGARGLVAQVDRGFLVAMVCSFAAHLLGAGYLIAQPAPVEPELSLSELQRDRFAASALMPIPKAPPPQTDPKVQRPAPTPEVARRTAPTPAPAAAAPRAAGSPDALKAKVARFGMLNIIGSVGTDGVVADLLKDSSSVGSVAEAMKHAGVRVASVHDVVAAERKGGVAGAAVTVEQLGTDGAGRVALEERATAAVVGRVREEAVTVDTPDIAPEALAAWMRSRRGAVQACYERELKRNRALHGRLVLKFAISPRGRVVGLDLSEGTLASPAVAECISTVARGWVLPFTPEDEVPVAFPFVFSPVS